MEVTTSKILKVRKEEAFPFLCNCLLCIDLPDYAHYDKDTVTPLSFVLGDPGIMRNIINRGYCFGVTQAQLNEIREKNLIRWPKETNPLFKIIEEEPTE